MLEQLHAEIYKLGFMLKILHSKYCGKSRKPIRDARKFRQIFLKCTTLEDEKDYYWGEFQMNLDAWMKIFNGSSKEDVNAGETNSYMSAGSVASSLKKHSVRDGGSPMRSVKIREDEMEDGTTRDRNTLELQIGQDGDKDDDDDEQDEMYGSESEDVGGFDDDMTKG